MGKKVRLISQNDNWSGTLIIHINSQELLNATNSTTDISKQVYNQVKELHSNNKFPTILLIDDYIDIPNTSVVETVGFGNNNVTLIQVRPNVSSKTLLLTQYTFFENGFFSREQTLNRSGFVGDYVDLGNSLSNLSNGVDVTSFYDVLFEAINNSYSSPPHIFVIKFNYTVLTCIGIKNIDNGTYFEAYFMDGNNTYKISISRSGTKKATLYKIQ